MVKFTLNINLGVLYFVGTFVFGVVSPHFFLYAPQVDIDKMLFCGVLSPVIWPYLAWRCWKGVPRI